LLSLLTFATVRWWKLPITRALVFENEFDAEFSTAALHWVSRGDVV